MTTYTVELTRDEIEDVVRALSLLRRSREDAGLQLAERANASLLSGVRDPQSERLSETFLDAAEATWGLRCRLDRLWR